MSRATHDLINISELAHHGPLPTIRNADRIVVLTEQGMAEEGTHETLMRQGGAYAMLYNMQSN